MSKHTWLPTALAPTSSCFCRSTRRVVAKQEALRILEEIKENVNTCCAITMEPDEVLELLEKLESYINE